jgi:hypothetical protein
MSDDQTSEASAAVRPVALTDKAAGCDVDGAR